MCLANLKTAIIIFTGVWLAPVLPASAGLVSSISYNQAINAFGPSTRGQGIYQYFTGNAIPVSQSVTVTSDATITANYNFTDNGNSAAIGINCAAAVDTSFENANEASNTYITFTLTQPATYNASFIDTVSGNFSGSDDFRLLSPNTQLFSALQPHNSSFSFTGVLSAGVTYELQESWNFSNPGAQYSPSGTGSDAVSLTLTAIPEPSPAALAALCGIAVLSRRRRPPSSHPT